MYIPVHSYWVFDRYRYWDTLPLHCIVGNSGPAIWAASVAQWKSTQSREQSVVGLNSTWGSACFFRKKELLFFVLCCIALLCCLTVLHVHIHVYSYIHIIAWQSAFLYMYVSYIGSQTIKYELLIYIIIAGCPFVCADVPVPQTKGGGVCSCQS